MSTKKKILLLTILVFPGLFYFFLELSNANFKKMAYYGPKYFDASKNDTVYYKLNIENVFENSESTKLKLDTNELPVFLIGFLDRKMKNEGYKLNGLLEYTQYQPEKLNYIDILLVSDFDSLKPKLEIKKDLKIRNNEIKEVFLNTSEFNAVRDQFFKGKPIHVFKYFFALVDKNRNIRGYYDPTFVSEVKRMILEFEHLKLRDEKAKLIKKNKIEKK
ncbi:MAG: hypothetical protein ACK5AY_13290 [Bacteroidota bacterium]|jgi:hypothetical protein